MTTTTPAPFQGAARAAAYLEENTLKRPTPAHVAAPPDELVAEPETAESVTGPTAAELVAVDVVDVTSLLPAVPPASATTGIRGLLARTGLKLAPSPAEVAALEAADVLRREEDLIRQSTWPRGVGILVANRKGGVGKTPTSVILGGILAAIRGGSVAVMEVSDDPGTLTYRSEGTPRRGIGELVTDYADIHSAGQLASYTAPQSSFAAVIGTTATRPRLDATDVLRAAKVVDEYYGFRVMDSGNQPSSSAFDGALAATDVLVIPVLNSAEAVLEAIALLDYLRGHSGMRARIAERAVIVRLTDGRVETPELNARLGQLLAHHHTGPVFEIPFDPHIAERGPITLAQLRPTTRAAFIHLAAGIVDTLNDVPLQDHPEIHTHE